MYAYLWFVVRKLLELPASAASLNDSRFDDQNFILLVIFIPKHTHAVTANGFELKVAIPQWRQLLFHQDWQVIDNQPQIHYS